MELSLAVTGRTALVVVSTDEAENGVVPSAVRWLVSLLVEDPPEVWPPVLVGTVAREGERLCVCVGGRALGETAASES